MVLIMVKCSQLDITGAQLKELAYKGQTNVTRVLQGFKVTFIVTLDGQRNAICSGVTIDSENLPLIGWPSDRANNYIVPVLKEKKGE